MAFLGACLFAYVRSTSYGVFLRNGGRIVVFFPVPVNRLHRLRGFGVAFWVGGVLMLPPGRVHVLGVALQFAVHAGHTKPWDDLFFVGSLARRWL